MSDMPHDTFLFGDFDEEDEFYATSAFETFLDSDEAAGDSEDDADDASGSDQEAPRRRDS
jgi:hypothetical protein